MARPTPTREPSVTHVAHPHVPLGMVLAIATAAQFMVVLDTTIVNVALPAMKAGLGLSATGQQWVVDGYLVAFGGLLMLAARSGDLLGHKRVFQAGLIVFTLASLVGGLAGDAGWLIAARIVQGAGAAALAPASLSLITASHPEGPARSRALAIWSSSTVCGGAIGLVLGGVLTSELSWRWVLLVNLPIGAALLVATAVCLVGRPAGRTNPRIDLPGALTVTLGVGALVYGVSATTETGWGSAQVVCALVAAAFLSTAFVVVETRRPEPLVRLDIFRVRGIAVANGLAACLGVTLTTTLFFIALYLQQVNGYSALRTGLAMVPQTAAMVVGVAAGKKAVGRFNARTVVVIGSAVATAGVAWLSLLPVPSEYVTSVLGPTVVLGAGVGFMMVPASETATAGVAAADAGLASGLFNTSRQLGGAIGLAVLVTVSSTALRHSHLGGLEAVAHGYRIALVVAAAVGVASTLLALLLPGGDRTTRS
ncbi:MFS transporter [Tsukamurella sp. 8F]|uniref:MFS transporter n=1 Tax=unclassified Tsukamurella TaxID=2633480 RepID=UPI0023B91AF5|nr:MULTISPECIES: MFS transporter [unclassified Tsukamurella]MDF0530795.1 MFS transporter [Tsukamurella sp. 8J]MDF0588321.1 MFS transporter [Tsukamurella sp. 8F]